MAALSNGTNIVDDNLILRLFDVGAVKFGMFTLKSGIESPVYVDLRVMVSHPDIMEDVANLMWKVAEKANCSFDVICGVPYTALPIATVMALKNKKPMVIRRKEAKDYGTRKMIEGSFDKGQTCLIIEDVVTSGSSVSETARSLQEVGLKVTDAIVLLDRCQGGDLKLAAEGITLHSAISLHHILDVLVKHEKIKADMVVKVQSFLEENQFLPAHRPMKKHRKLLTYSERIQICKHPLTKLILSVMETKQTNLAFAADLTSAEEVLKCADLIGPHICIFKTHVDIIEDFTQEFVKKLVQLSERHNFIIFEDRKFADIGNTVTRQYSSGIYKISSWAHLTNAHSVSGPGVIKGLKASAHERERGCLLIAEMSSEGNLATGLYSKQTIQMAEDNDDFVIGFITTSSLTNDPKFLHMTPGVKLAPKIKPGDKLGQQYLSPFEVVCNRGTDVIIVGRDIYEASNRVEAAIELKKAGMSAYYMRLKNSDLD